jgi:hypothetical protein
MTVDKNRDETAFITAIDTGGSSMPNIRPTARREGPLSTMITSASPDAIGLTTFHWASYPVMSEFSLAASRLDLTTLWAVIELCYSAQTVILTLSSVSLFSDPRPSHEVLIAGAVGIPNLGVRVSLSTNFHEACGAHRQTALMQLPRGYSF